MNKKMIFTKEVKIGLVTIISMVLLYFGINYLKGINLFKPANHYFVSFTNIEGITVSSPVYVEGFKVGLVRNIFYDYTTTNKITVEIRLEDAMKINKGSYVIVRNSLLGGAELHIKLNKYVEDYLTSGESIEGRMEEDMMASVQEKILPGVEALLPKLDTILTGLQRIVNHPALTESLVHIERTTGSLESSARELDQLLANDVPVIVSNLKTISSNFTEVSSNLKSLDISTTIRLVNTTLKNVEATTNKLNSSDNSLGLLLNDKALYDNLTNTMDSANKLLIDLKENPKRYVHFSVF